MSVQAQIQKDMIVALKARDQNRREVLSFLASEFKRVAIDKRLENPMDLPDADAVQILQKQLKLRKEALDFAVKAERQDLITQAEYESNVIREYLPASLGEEETQALATQVIAELGATSVKQMGQVMAAATAKAPYVDKSRLSAIVKSLLNKN